MLIVMLTAMAWRLHRLVQLPNPRRTPEPQHFWSLVPYTVVISGGKHDYNRYRRRLSLGYQPPARDATTYTQRCTSVASSGSQTRKGTLTGTCDVGHTGYPHSESIGVVTNALNHVGPHSRPGVAAGMGDGPPRGTLGLIAFLVLAVVGPVVSVHAAGSRFDARRSDRGCTSAPSVFLRVAFGSPISQPSTERVHKDRWLPSDSRLWRAPPPSCVEDLQHARPKNDTTAKRLGN
jgi:hypothetical protein